MNAEQHSQIDRLLSRIMENNTELIRICDTLPIRDQAEFLPLIQESLNTTGKLIEANSNCNIVSDNLHNALNYD